MFGKFVSQPTREFTYIYLDLHPLKIPSGEFESVNLRCPPERVYHATVLLIHNELVVGASSLWLREDRSENCSFFLDASQVPDPSMVMARVIVREFHRLAILEMGPVSPGPDPERSFAYSPIPHDPGISEFKILSCRVSCDVEGNKRKSLNSIYAKFTVESRSDQPGLILPYISADESHVGSLDYPAYLEYGERTAGGIQFSDLQASTTIGDLERQGYKVPSFKNISKITIYPFLAVYEKRRDYDILFDSPNIKDA